MTFGLEKGQCSQADLNKSFKMVPKALDPFVLGERSVGRGRGGQMMFCHEPYVLGEHAVCVCGGGGGGGNDIWSREGAVFTS